MLSCAANSLIREAFGSFFTQEVFSVNMTASGVSWFGRTPFYPTLALSPSGARLFVGALTVNPSILSDTASAIYHASTAELLGEMSFLLGSKPGVTVVAEAPVTIVELQQSKVLRVLQHDPQLAAQVFRSLAVTLSERVKALDREVKEMETQLANSAGTGARPRPRRVAGDEWEALLAAREALSKRYVGAIKANLELLESIGNDRDAAASV